MSQKVDKLFNNLVYWALFSFSLFLFTSNAALNFFHLFALLSGAYFCIKNFKISWERTSVFYLYIYCAFAVFSVLQTPLVEDKIANIGEVRVYIIPLLFLYALKVYCGRGLEIIKLRRLFNVVFVTTSLANISGIIALFSGFNILRWSETTDKLRATGMYGMAVTYGYGIQFFCIFCLFCCVYKNALKKYFNIIILYIATFTSILGLYFSYTRGAYLGFLVAAPFVFLSYSQKAFKRVLGGSALILVFIVIGVIYLKGSNKLRVLQKVNSESNLIRLSQYEAAFYGFKENPVFGLGFRNFGDMSKVLKKKYDIPFKDFQGHAHNNFIEALVGTGIFGFFFFVMFHWCWLRESLQRKDLFKSLYVPIIVVLMVSGMVQNTFTDGENVFLIMLIFLSSHIKQCRLMHDGKPVD